MLSGDEVEKIAWLARLALSAEEKASFAARINSVLDYVQVLRKIPVEHIEPMSHVHGVTNAFRPDVVGPHLPIEAVIKAAPEHAGRFIKVPLIVTGE